MYDLNARFKSDSFFVNSKCGADRSPFSQKCTIRRNLSIASLVGRLEEKYR